MALPRPTFADFRVRRKEAMDALFFDRRFKTIVEMMAAYVAELERQGASAEDVVRLGLDRIDEVLTPALTRVQQASELGFLIGVSSTSLTLQVGEEAVFEINEATRGLFTPTPFLTISRSTPGTENQYAVAQLIAWNAETGGLDVEILAIEGISGAQTDWIISASSGLPASIVAKALQVTTDAGQVASDRAYVESVAASIAAGPVLSVAGKTGAVSLVMGDIANLVSTLAAKADMSHSHPQSAITNLVADLAAKAALSHGHAMDDVSGLNDALNNRLLRSGGSLAGSLNAADQEIAAAKLKDYALTVNARGSISGAQAIDYALGNYVTATITGATQFSVTNPPANAIGGGFVLVLTNGGVGAVTWMNGTKWAGGVAPSLTPSGIDVLSFLTHDGGATWRGSVLSLDAK